MDSHLLQETKGVLKKLGLRAEKKFSQNFLIDENILNTIIEQSDLKNNEQVIEVGSGLGVLTSALLLTGAKVFGIEKDANLLSFLKGNLGTQKNLDLIAGDVLEVLPPLVAKLKTPYKIVANLPYALSGKLIQLFLELEPRPTRLVLMLQLEVGQRLTAKAGQQSILGVLSQMLSEIIIAKIVSKNCFYPVPKVDSAIVIFKPKKDVKISKFLARLVKISFASRRQTLANNLSVGLDLNKQKIEEIIDYCGLKKLCRAQELTLENWQNLAQQILQYQK